VTKDATVSRSRRHVAVSAHVNWLVPILMLGVLLPAGCARVFAPEIVRDERAEHLTSVWRQVNPGLTRFKFIGTVTVSGPDRPQQHFRAAFAGHLPDGLRIDLFSMVGGASATISMDGTYLYLVRHATREYHKKRLGSGSLRSVIRIDATVDDLLQIMAGRIPMSQALHPRFVDGDNQSGVRVAQLDDKGRMRQRITADEDLRPVKSEWFDGRRRLTHTLMIGGHQDEEGCVVPQRFQLAAHTGERLSVTLTRYEVNPDLDARLFAPDRPEW
jgi:hypothetical protein